MGLKEKAKESAKAEKKKIRDMSLKQKCRYFWDYYKGVLVALICIGVAVDIGITVYRDIRRVHLLDIGMVNTISFGDEIDEMIGPFREKYNADDIHRAITVDSSFQIDLDETDEVSQASYTKLLVQGQTDTMDVLLMPKDIFDNFASLGLFEDIRKVLSEEMQKELSGQIVYARCDEDTEDMPYGIVLTDVPKLENIYPAGDVYVTFVNRIKNPEMAEEFLKYLLP